MVPDASELEAVMRYHERTKHHFNRYAPGPGELDWANQPDPFRRYAGAVLTRLPILGPDEEPVSPAYESLYARGALSRAGSRCSLASMGNFLEIESAARRLSAEERRRLLLSLAASLREEGRLLPAPRSFTSAEMQSWTKEDERDLACARLAR